MRKRLIIIVAAFFLCAAGNVSAQTKPVAADIREIILETGDGFCFDCERVTTLRAGGESATYRGGKRSRFRRGDFSGEFAAKDFVRLAQAFIDGEFFELNSRYEGTTSDVATVKITVVSKSDSKTVVNFKRSSEPRLKNIEQAFNRAAEKIVWRAANEAQKEQSKTVRDFYLQLPADLTDGSESRAERIKRIQIEDAKNGYLKLAPTEDQGADGYTEIALFKKSSGGYVVGIASIVCTENCLGTARFFERLEDRWREVSDAVYPLDRDGELILYRSKKPAALPDYDTAQTFWTIDRLPREGRTVRAIYTSEGKAKEFDFFSATWNGEKFIADEPLPENLAAPVAPSQAVLQKSDQAWKSFFGELRAAVKRRDRKKLRRMMNADFSYNCCDEPYPDKRSGAFLTWDGVDRKDFQGWKNLERELQRTAQLYESSDEDKPMRFLGSASFEFADNRWLFVAFGADEM